MLDTLSFGWFSGSLVHLLLFYIITCSLFLFLINIHAKCFSLETWINSSSFTRDEKVVSQAIDLNEQLQNVLARHDVLLSERSTSTANHVNHQDGHLSTRSTTTANHSANHADHEEEEEEEEAEQLSRRYFYLNWSSARPLFLLG